MGSNHGLCSTTACQAICHLCSTLGTTYLIERRNHSAMQPEPLTPSFLDERSLNFDNIYKRFGSSTDKNVSTSTMHVMCSTLYVDTVQCSPQILARTMHLRRDLILHYTVNLAGRTVLCGRKGRFHDGHAVWKRYIHGRDS